MGKSEIIRAYQLQPGDLFKLHGRIYQVGFIKMGVIFYGPTNGTPYQKTELTLGAKSKQFIERITPETISINNKK